MSKVSYIKKEGDSAVFVGTYMEAYIPMNTFETTNALELGDSVRVFGLFNFKVFNTLEPTESDIAKAKLETFCLPSLMESTPTEQEIRLMVADNAIEGTIRESHKVLKFYNGDLLVKNLNIIKDVANVEIFLKILNSAKIPRTIPYDALPKMLERCVDLNGINARVSPLVYETLMTEICRYFKDPSKPFRLVIGAGKAGQNEYIPMRIRGIAQNNSAYTGITFEEFDASALTAINKTRSGVEQQVSPIEKVLKY
ncbi:MAG: hypothetical protein ACRC0G_07895 [Fusobacteriaceae bacterium]